MRLIDADALIKNTEIFDDMYEVNWTIGKVRAWIANAPTIEAEPVKHGRWDDNHNCTVCKKKALCEEKPDPYHPCHLLTLFYVDSDYCPNCGAKMDGDKL